MEWFVIDKNLDYRNNKQIILENWKDATINYNYADAWTSNERVSSIVYSSEKLWLTATETFTYSDVSWKKVLQSITLS
jgi:hypothetical protein